MAIIATLNNQRIDLLNPDPEEIAREDILWGLAGAFRYACQTDPRWAVLKHSILAALCAIDLGYSPRVRLGTLYHDAPEAFTGDITSPLKKILAPLFRPIERGLEQAISVACALPVLTEFEQEQVAYADYLCLCAESAYLRIEVNTEAPAREDFDMATRNLYSVAFMTNAELFDLWVELESYFRQDILNYPHESDAE